MKPFLFRPSAGRTLAVMALVLATAACAVYTPPRPQLGQVVDPSVMPTALHTAEWDIGALRYVYQGQGINYYEAGLMPVMLLFRNKTGRYPMVHPEECLGITPTGAMFRPYAVPEAAEVVFASTAYKKSAEAAVVGGLTGAAVGAGLGALIGAAVSGGRSAGTGALIGGGIGAVTGAASAQNPSMAQYHDALYQEMSTYVWKPIPVAPMALTPGYLYFPASVGISAVRVTVRADNEVRTFDIPVDNPPGVYPQAY